MQRFREKCGASVAGGSRGGAWCSGFVELALRALLLGDYSVRLREITLSNPWYGGNLMPDGPGSVLCTRPIFSLLWNGLTQSGIPGNGLIQAFQGMACWGSRFDPLEL